MLAKVPITGILRSFNSTKGKEVSLRIAFRFRRFSINFIFAWRQTVSKMLIDFKVTQNHTKIVSKDDYYPFGLTFSSYSRPVMTDQNFKYNSFEYQQDLGLNWYDYIARHYDPALGRWYVIDPAANMMRRHSPYNYAFDNPVRYIDPDGMKPEEGEQKKEEKRQANSFEQMIWAILSFMNQQGEVFNQALGNDDPTFEENVSIYATHLELTLMPLSVIDGAGAPNSTKSKIAKKVIGKSDEAVEIVIDAKRFPESAKHAQEAIENGVSNTGKIDRAGAAARRRKALKGIKTEANKDRDEFPPAVVDNGNNGSSVKPIISSDNRGSGGSLGWQIRKLADGTRVRVIVTNDGTFDITGKKIR